VWAIPAKGGGSRAFCDRMNSWAQGEGQPGLGYIFWRKEGDAIEGAGPIAKNIGPERTDAIRAQMGLDDGDACFFRSWPAGKSSPRSQAMPATGQGPSRA
jgi:aspartyl-tRNA synthetase